jgi:predicted transcriptional regulator
LCPIVGHLGENVGYLVLYPYPARTSVERKEMNLSELVGGTIVTAGVKTPLFELATKMEAEGVGSIAITDANGEFVGIVTDRDIVIAVAHSSEISTPAEDVMTVAPDMVEIDTDVSDAVSWLIPRSRARRGTPMPYMLRRGASLHGADDRHGA